MSSFYIIDDDKGVRKVLKNIICQHNLGDVIGEACNGVDAIKEIKEKRPQIVLVDLLLPGMDGIAIVSEIKRTDENIVFIMISEVSSKEMVSKAYERGIEFYIHKPINLIEVLAIISKVKESMKMYEVIQSFEKAIFNMNTFKDIKGGKELQPFSHKDRVKKVLAQLGIAGEAGSNDIVEMITILSEIGEDSRERFLNQRLSELYNLLNERYITQNNTSSNVAAIEQRIRRAINKALGNLADLGIEDYGNDIFNKYANSLFDFQEVRKQMNFARHKSNYGGKISVKKFIEGVMIDLKNES